MFRGLRNVRFFTDLDLPSLPRSERLSFRRWSVDLILFRGRSIPAFFLKGHSEDGQAPSSPPFWFFDASWSAWEWRLKFNLPFIGFRKLAGEGPAAKRWDAAHPATFWKEFQAEEFRRIAREHSALGLTALDGSTSDV